MANEILKSIKSSIKNWYLQLLIGILFIAVGVYTFMSPGAAYLSLAILFSISFFISGLSDIIFSLSNKNELDNWGWILAIGILTFVTGIILMIHPEISMVTIPFIIGFLFMFRSVAGIGIALDMKSYGIKEWGWMMAFGILGMIFSFIMIWNPIFAGMTLVVLTGMVMLIIGFFHVFLGFKLKKLKGKLHL